MSLFDKIFFRVLGFKSPKFVNIKSFREIYFECIEGCADCCRMYLVPVPEKGLQERLKDGLSTIAGGKKITKRGNDFYCTFLKNKRCSIHEYKPLTCQGYPFSIDPLTEEVYVDTRCRGIGKGRLLPKEEIDKMINCRKEYWSLEGLSDAEKEDIHRDFFMKHAKQTKSKKQWSTTP